MNVTTDIPLTDYVKMKIGQETGHGHDGYHDALLGVASKAKTPELAKLVQDSVDAVASAIRFEGRYSLRGESGQRYTVEHPSMLIGVILKLHPYLGQDLGVENVFMEITRDLRQMGR